VSDNEPASRRRLDPDRAAETARRSGRAPSPPVAIDTRRYQRMIGLIGIALVIVVSIAFLTTHRAGTPGIPAGDQLRNFAAPLATSNLNGDANTHPPCTAARHDPRALNICLLSRSGPLVLAFFVTKSGGCERQVDALQALSARFAGKVQFAAVAVRSSHEQARAAVHRHNWTIPVAYDADGAVGEIYGVEVCPIVELAARGGRIEQRLIGDHWASPQTLAPPVERLLQRSPA
jgi:hypothetical protein